MIMLSDCVNACRFRQHIVKLDNASETRKFCGSIVCLANAKTFGSPLLAVNPAFAKTDEGQTSGASSLSPGRIWPWRLLPYILYPVFDTLGRIDKITRQAVGHHPESPRPWDNTRRAFTRTGPRHGGQVIGFDGELGLQNREMHSSEDPRYLVERYSPGRANLVSEKSTHSRPIRQEWAHQLIF